MMADKILKILDDNKFAKKFCVFKKCKNFLSCVQKKIENF